MEARALTIEEKLRTFPVSVVSPADFKVGDGGAVDPRIVIEDPNVTLYCLDWERQRALFVETPPECDLYSPPFFYQAQYDAAVRLIEVPFDTLHRLAAEVTIDPSRLILIYSVGRCGSTLVSHAFRTVDGVMSISEPDVFTQMLGLWGPGDLDGGDRADLLKSCTLLQCAPGRAAGAGAWALKFRSMVTEMGDLFYSRFPEARVVFLYRRAGPWARSFLRIMRVEDPTAPFPLAGGFLRRMHRRLEGRESASALELLACMWVSVMEKCMAMQHQGIPMFIVRYEELNAAPKDVLGPMMAYCGIPPSPAGDLDAVLREDSQAGSALARGGEGETPVELSQAHIAELGRLIGEYSDARLSADAILPGTYFP